MDQGLPSTTLIHPTIDILPQIEAISDSPLGRAERAASLFSSIAPDFQELCEFFERIVVSIRRDTSSFYDDLINSDRPAILITFQDELKRLVELMEGEGRITIPLQELEQRCEDVEEANLHELIIPEFTRIIDDVKRAQQILKTIFDASKAVEQELSNWAEEKNAKVLASGEDLDEQDLEIMELLSDFPGLYDVIHEAITSCEEGVEKGLEMVRELRNRIEDLNMEVLREVMADLARLYDVPTPDEEDEEYYAYEVEKDLSAKKIDANGVLTDVVCDSPPEFPLR
jgi:hypothetical protein